MFGLESLIGPVVGIAGGIYGDYASRDDRRRAEEMQRAQLAAMAEGRPEDISSRLRQYELAGLESELGPSQVSQLRESPEGRAAQMEALKAIQAQVRAGGMTPETRAAYNQMQRQNAQQAQAQQNQIMQQAQMRGQGSGGAALMSQIAGAQAGANQASEASDRLAAQEAQLRRQGIQDYAQQGQQLRGQDYNAELARRSAADQFAMANQRIGASNIDRRQDVSNRNVGGYNQALGDYQNRRMQFAQGMSGAYGNAGNQAAEQAGRTASRWANIGGGIGQGAGSMLAANQAQSNADRDYELKKRQAGIIG